MGLRLKMGLAIAALVSSVLLINGLVMIAEERAEQRAERHGLGRATAEHASDPRRQRHQPIGSARQPHVGEWDPYQR